MDKYYIPQYLDEKDRILIFTPLEALMLVICLVLGVATKHLFLFVFVAGLIFYLLRKADQASMSKRLKENIYWHMPSCFSNLKAMGPSHIREYLG